MSLNKENPVSWFKSIFKKGGVGESDWEKQHEGTYVGETKDGFPHGKGRFVLCNKIIVKEGMWVFGSLHGKGRTEVWSNPHPTDLRDHPNPAYWEGNYIHGKLNGEGVYSGASGKYEGNFANDIEHGLGKFTPWHGRSVYEGHFINGKAHGTGTIRTYDGEVLYSGEWDRNCPMEKLNVPFTGPDQGIWSEDAYKFLLADEE